MVQNRKCQNEYEKAAIEMKEKYGDDWMDDEKCIDELCEKFGMDARIVCFYGAAQSIENVTENDIKEIIEQKDIEKYKKYGIKVV